MAAISPKIQAIINERFPPDTHPYRVLERKIAAELSPSHTLLDIGCGRTAPVLGKYRGDAARLLGVDLVEFTDAPEGLELTRGDIGEMPFIADASVDLAYSRSVMEHVEDVDKAYAEIWRVLKPHGRYIFLTPNLWDYGSLVAWAVPNSLHPWIVKNTEGRDEQDTFPTFFRSNTKRAVGRLADKHGFVVESADYLGQYPSYLVFNTVLFRLGAAYQEFIASRKSLNFLQGWIFCTLRKTEKAPS